MSRTSTRSRGLVASLMAAPAVGLSALLVLTLGAARVPAVGALQIATSTPLPLYALPNPSIESGRSSGSIAISPFDGRIVANANMYSDTVTISVPSQSRVQAEIAVGDDPRGVAFTPSGAQLLVTNRGDGTLTVIDALANEVQATIDLGGVWPYHVVAVSNTRAYVSMMGSAEIVVVDLAADAVESRIPVTPFPAGLAAWGDFLYVTHFWDGRVSLIYQPRGQVVQSVQIGQDVGASQAIELDITRGLAYLPETIFNSQNPTLLYDTAAYPTVNVIHLADLMPVRDARISLSTADQPVNMPFAAALDRFNRRLYVVNAGDDSLSVIDLVTGEARAHLRVGANPRGVVLSPDSTRVYVHNAIDGTITSVSAGSKFAIETVLPVTTTAGSIDVLIGATLFHSAEPRLSTDGWLSCATCHFDGMSDGRVWQGMGRYTGALPDSEEPPGSPRNTPLLYGLLETVPYNAARTWDELADVEDKIRSFMGGSGLMDGSDDEELALPHPPLGAPNTGFSPDLDSLTTYMLSLRPPPGYLSISADLIVRGSQVYAAQGCAECHVGTVGTSLQAYDVGTGGHVDTPSLRWLWLSAPYFHDGSAATLRDVFEQEGRHRLTQLTTREDIDALIAYLQHFEDAPLP